MRTLLDKLATSAQLPALPGFENMQRFWEPDTERWTAKILPGEYYVTSHDEAITTVLGSCIAACIRDPVARIGGMNHFMLPQDLSAGENPWLDPATGLATRYGSYAMEKLINDLLRLGGNRNRLEMKLFGGGRVLVSMTDVGARNIDFVRSYIALEGFRVAAEDLGGQTPRKVIYFPSTGLVRVRRLRPIENRAIHDREQQYLASLEKIFADGEIELFN